MPGAYHTMVQLNLPHPTTPDHTMSTYHIYLLLAGLQRVQPTCRSRDQAGQANPVARPKAATRRQGRPISLDHLPYQEAVDAKGLDDLLGQVAEVFLDGAVDRLLGVPAPKLAALLLRGLLHTCIHRYTIYRYDTFLYHMYLYIPSMPSGMHIHIITYRTQLLGPSRRVTACRLLRLYRGSGGEGLGLKAQLGAMGLGPTPLRGHRLTWQAGARAQPLQTHHHQYQYQCAPKEHL
jgi:hypothetical protein